MNLKIVQSSYEKKNRGKLLHILNEKVDVTMKKLAEYEKSLAGLKEEQHSADLRGIQERFDKMIEQLKTFHLSGRHSTQPKFALGLY